jgi:hypothetical protein
MRIADACIEGAQRRDYGGEGEEYEFAGQTTYSASPEDVAPGEVEAEAEEAEAATAQE